MKPELISLCLSVFSCAMAVVDSASGCYKLYFYIALSGIFLYGYIIIGRGLNEAVEFKKELVKYVTSFPTKVAVEIETNKDSLKNLRELFKLTIKQLRMFQTDAGSFAKSSNVSNTERQIYNSSISFMQRYEELLRIELNNLKNSKKPLKQERVKRFSKSIAKLVEDFSRF